MVHDRLLRLRLNAGGDMTTEELARMLVGSLRKYMREKTPKNNIVRVPVLQLAVWSAPDGRTDISLETLDSAAWVLHNAGICQRCLQDIRPRGTELQLQMTENGRAMSDEAIAEKICQECLTPTTRA